MTSQLFPAYRHSGKFEPRGPVLALVAAVVLGWPLGFAYAYALRWIPFVYAHFLLTLGYGLVFGFGTAFLMKWANVRNNSLAFFTGLGVGVIAWYFNWNAHVYSIFKGVPVLSSPAIVWHAMQVLYAHGSWGLRDSGNVTGVILGIVWLAEAGVIVGTSALMSVTMVFDTPFCEKNQCWLDEEKKINTLQAFTDAEHLAALKSGDLAPLAQSRPKAPDAPTFARLILKHSARTDEFCTVRVENVTITRDRNGKSTEKKTELTRNLVVPRATFDLLTRFETFERAEVAEPATADLAAV